MHTGALDNPVYDENIFIGNTTRTSDHKHDKREFQNPAYFETRSSSTGTTNKQLQDAPLEGLYSEVTEVPALYETPQNSNIAMVPLTSIKANGDEVTFEDTTLYDEPSGLNNGYAGECDDSCYSLLGQTHDVSQPCLQNELLTNNEEYSHLQYK